MSVMNMQTYPQSSATSFTSRFLLLLMVVGVADIDASYHHYKVLDRIEILFQAARLDVQSSGIAITEGIPEYAAVKDRPADFYEGRPGAVLFSLLNTGRVNTRGFYHSHVDAGSFNIPHQNSDEDEAFVSPDVA